MHDSEFFHPFKLSQLPYQIREHARAVTRGSLPALARVHAFRKSLSVQQQLLLAPMYYSILDLSHLASISTLDWDSDAETVHQRLSAVLSAINSMIDLIQFRIPHRAMEEIWVRIWAWMQLVDDFRDQLSVPLIRFQSAVSESFPQITASNPSTPSPHHQLFSQILMAYLIEHRTAASNFLQSNPRIFAIVGRAWNTMLSQEAADHSRQDFRLSEAAAGIYAASFSLLHYGRELVRRDGPHMEQLIVGVGGTWGHLASLLIRHLQQGIRKPHGSPTDKDLERAYAILDLLPYAHREDGYPRLELRAALVEKGLVAVLTGLSFRLVKTPHTGQELHTGTPELAFHALMRLVMFDARSELRVMEALRAGLLHNTLVQYVGTGHHLRGLMLDEARYLLATGIPQYCVSVRLASTSRGVCGDLKA
ncbi:hypothetical protein C8F01DRAFT_1369277 [Mycena amicta]|nr:hypothetical protein C8F01DRAFT_1369277 [Mycena amicta]